MLIISASWILTNKGSEVLCSKAGGGDRRSVLYSQRSRNLALGSGACCLLCLSLAHAWGSETFGCVPWPVVWKLWCSMALLVGKRRIVFRAQESVGLEITPAVPNAISSSTPGICHEHSHLRCYFPPHVLHILLEEMQTFTIGTATDDGLSSNSVCCSSVSWCLRVPLPKKFPQQPGTALKLALY